MSTTCFRPVRGLENIIQQQSIIDGHVYFATDTGKIFVDAQGERHLMGGSGASILYANDTNIKQRTDGKYELHVSTLEDEGHIPRTGDLIINSDGRFFKVSNVNMQYIICTLLAVSGSGGGGSITPGGPSKDERDLDVTWHDFQPNFIAGTDHYLEYTITSQVDRYLTLSYIIEAGEGVVDQGSVQVISGVRDRINVGKYMSTESLNAIYITITGANSNEFTQNFFSIRKINLQLQQDNNNFSNYKLYDSSFSYSVNAYGLIAKTLAVSIDDGDEYTILLPEARNYEQYPIEIDCDKLTPGVHNIKVRLIAAGISTPPITTDFIYHPADAEDDIYLLLAEYPSSVYSYENPIIYYWIWDTSKKTGEYNAIEYYINNDLIDRENAVQKYDEPLSWSVGILPANGTSTLNIMAKTDTKVVSREFTINVIEDARFNPITTNAILMLDANGRSNRTSSEKRIQWSYKNIHATMNNFNWYNNGWFLDENNRSCLRLNNGAYVDIPLTISNDSAPTTGGFTVEFEFKPYNLYSYNLLTQSTETIEIEDDKDDKVEIKRVFDASKAAISYISGSGESAYGFCLGTQDAYLRLSDGSHVTARYMNDKIINVAITFNAATQQMMIYINGVLSGVSSYTRQLGHIPAGSHILRLTSEFCDLDIYNIRIYRVALSSADIVQNYMSSKKDLELYDANKMFTTGTVKLSELEEYNSKNVNNMTIPYIIFKTGAPDILPYNKANADVTCDIKFVNPALDYAFDTGLITEDYYKKHCPSFLAEGVPINVQGTSSQKYPRKNFKGKFKKPIEKQKFNCINKNIIDKTLTKFYMNDNIGEKTFTWKADYMDSSSCHNTGFASYAQILYWNHPLDYYCGTTVDAFSNTMDTGTYLQQYRTSLYGFPVLAFHERSDKTTEFIGIYNFNLDKGADHTLGMDSTLNSKVVKEVVEISGQSTKVYYPYSDICECWEMANNLGGRCSFRGNPFDEGYNYSDKKYWTTDKDGKIIEGCSDLGDDIEVRYHVDKDAIEGAWENRNKPLEDGGTYIGSEAAFNVLLGGKEDGSERSGAYRHLEKFYKWLQDSFFAFDLSKSEDLEWAQTLVREKIKDEDYVIQTNENGSYYNDDGTPYDINYATLKAERKAKFETEFDQHLNKEYCMIYYILTEFLLLFDSRGKNMMFSSWGPLVENGDYIWFPIFYDVDTQLGVNNSGIPSWEYNVEPSTGFNNVNGAKAFSTSNSLLWMNFHEAYQNEILTSYRALRESGRLTLDKLNGYYNTDYEISQNYCMKGALPINVMNENEYYKYIEPSEKGYIIGLNEFGQPTYRITDAYFYCLQGTRELHRAQFLRNRFNYYDSKWMAQNYKPGATGGTDVFWRANANKGENVPEALYSNLKFNIKPSLDQYLVLWLDDSANQVVPIFVKGGETEEIDLQKFIGQNSTYTEQIIHIGGPDYIQEYGNISLLYVNNYEQPSPALTKIELGNEHDSYENPFFNTTDLLTAAKNKPLLKVFDITNLRGKAPSSIDLSASSKLETCKALGTAVQSILFSSGVALKQLYLPETLNSLNLVEAYQLNKIFYNKNEILDEDGKQTKEGMYIDQMTHVDEASNCLVARLNDVTLINGAFGLESYKLISELTSAKNATKAHGVTIPGYNENLALHLEQVHWSPYTQLGEGAVYDPDKADTYKYSGYDFTYNDYTNHTTEQWDKLIAEGRLYSLNNEKLTTTPTSLDLLDNYFIWDEINQVPIEKEQYTNVTTNITHISFPVITGELFINNDETHKISEYDIANKYNKVFPDLIIRAKCVDPAKRAVFVSLDEYGNKFEIATYRYPSDTEITITAPNINSLPLPAHSDFVGWKLDGTNIIYSMEEIKTLDFNEVDEYVFIMCVKTHEYNITFKDGDNTEYVVPILYNSTVTAPNIVPYKPDDTSLNYNEVYRFKGWTNDSSYHGVVPETTANNVVINLANEKAIKDTTYYAVFIKDSVYNNILDATYFNITPDTAYIDDDDATYGYTSRCATITLKSGYNSKLKGKITIPTWIADPSNPSVEIPVVAVGGFMDSANITHCFFDNHKEFHIKKILVSGFEECLALRFIELPPSLRFIDNKAFYDCDQLAMTPGNEHDLRVDGNVYYIGSQALSGLTAATMTTNIFIGPKVKYIEENAFAYSNRILGTLTFGTATQPTEITRIVDNAFKTNGGRQYTELIMYCQDINHKTQLETLINSTEIPYKTVSYPYSNS